MVYRILFTLILSATMFGLIIGCGKDSTPPPHGTQPGEYRWPSTPGNDGIQYGEQIQIPEGTFTMGWIAGDQAPDCGNEARPTSSVTISSFWLDKYEVTNSAFRAYVNAAHPADSLIPTPNILVAGNVLPGGWYGDTVVDPSHSFINKSNYALMGVSWYGAIYYANWRSHYEGLSPVYSDTTISGLPSIKWDRTKNGYRLPTEAEWEYAARGSSNFQFAWGNAPFFETSSQLPRCGFNPSLNISNFVTDTNLARRIFYGPIGRFKPNNLPFGDGIGPFGNYDLNGSASEWVFDYASSYTATAKHDPVNDSLGILRVIKGGSAASVGTYSAISSRLLSYNRRYAYPTLAGMDTTVANGFRLARNR